MNPDMINCVILRIHVDEKMKMPSRAIQEQTIVREWHGSKKINSAAQNFWTEA